MGNKHRKSTTRVQRVEEMLSKKKRRMALPSEKEAILLHLIAKGAAKAALKEEEKTFERREENLPLKRIEDTQERFNNPPSDGPRPWKKRDKKKYSKPNCLDEKAQECTSP